jgi:hypothetical protein
MAHIAISILIASLVVMESAQARTITVRATECQRLVQHASTNNAAYTPGVDVRGKAVAPADLDGGSNMIVPEAIDIQIGVDLADRMGLQDSAVGADAKRKVLPYEGKVPLGTITVKGQDVFWNGERIVPQDQVLLAEACKLSMTPPSDPPLPSRKPQ